MAIMFVKSVLALITLSAAAFLQSLPLCLLIGSSASVSVSADSGRRGKNNGRVVLEEDLFDRALAHAGLLESQQQLTDGENSITERLRRGEIEALFEVAKSMNDSGDKISSVLMWHSPT